MIRYAWLDFRNEFLMNKMKKYDLKGIEYDIKLAEIIDSLPINHFEGMDRRMILERDGYVKNNKYKDKGVLVKDDSSFGHCMFVHITEIDDSRPWTIIRMEEYYEIIYLDQFKKVDGNLNYYEYKALEK